MDLILTVVVGWLGLVIGGFFGEKTMETLQERRELSAKKADLLVERYENFVNNLIKLEKK